MGNHRETSSIHHIAASTDIKNTRTMKGTFIHLDNKGDIEFDATGVRTGITQDGKFEVIGWMPRPNKDGEIRVQFQLDNKDAPTGDYLYPAGGVSKLLIIVNKTGYQFEAISGTVSLTNEAPGQARIHGTVVFVTEERYGDHYDVRVDFDISD